MSARKTACGEMLVRCWLSTKGACEENRAQRKVRRMFLLLLPLAQTALVTRLPFDRRAVVTGAVAALHAAPAMRQQRPRSA